MKITRGTREALFAFVKYIQEGNYPNGLSLNGICEQFISEQEIVEEEPKPSIEGLSLEDEVALEDAIKRTAISVFEFLSMDVDLKALDIAWRPTDAGRNHLKIEMRVEFGGDLKTIGDQFKGKV